MSDCRFDVSPVNYPDPNPDPDVSKLTLHHMGNLLVVLKSTIM